MYRARLSSAQDLPSQIGVKLLSLECPLEGLTPHQILENLKHDWKAAVVSAIFSVNELSANLWIPEKSFGGPSVWKGEKGVSMWFSRLRLWVSVGSGTTVTYALQLFVFFHGSKERLYLLRIDLVNLRLWSEHDTNQSDCLLQNTYTNAEKLLTAAEELAQTGECNADEIYSVAHELESHVTSFAARVEQRRRRLDLAVHFYTQEKEVGHQPSLCHVMVMICYVNLRVTDMWY